MLYAALLATMGCQAQSNAQDLTDKVRFAPAAIRTLTDLGAVADGRADDTAVLARAFADSDRYCIEGQGKTYRVTGTLRVTKNLCLRNAVLVQSAVPAETAAYIDGSCPTIEDPSAVVDCADPAIPPSRVAQLWASLSMRTLLIRSEEKQSLRVNLENVKIDRGVHSNQGSRSDAAGIWLDGADRVDFRDVEITGNGKGYGLLIVNSRNVTLTNLWIHDLVWSPFRGDRPLSQAAVAATGWNSVPIREFRELGRDGLAEAKFYGVRIQEQLTCVSLANVSHVRIDNARIERCMARFDTGDLPWQTDGLSIGQSSSVVTINGAKIDSTWEGIDIVAGGTGTDRLRINDLTVSNSFSFGLKMGYKLRNVRVSRLNVDGAGLAGVVIYGPVQDVRVARASIKNVGIVKNGRSGFSPWPRGNRSGIRIDGLPGSAPENLLFEDVVVQGRPSDFEFGVLNTGGDHIRLIRFKARGFGNTPSRGIDLRKKSLSK